MIRLILIATILILYLIIGIPVLLIEWVIGKFNPRARDISSLRMVQGSLQTHAVDHRVPILPISVMKMCQKIRLFSMSEITAAILIFCSPIPCVRI